MNENPKPDNPPSDLLGDFGAGPVDFTDLACLAEPAVLAFRYFWGVPAIGPVSFR
jgi:hypothetical protein